MKRAFFLVFCIILACGLSPDVKARNILENYLEDPSTVVRINAARSLGMIGDRRGAEVLIQILQAEDPDVQSAALSALFDIGESEFNPLIIELCRSESQSVREAAYRLTTRMDDTRAKDALIAGLRDESGGVRRSFTLAWLSSARTISYIKVCMILKPRSVSRPQAFWVDLAQMIWQNW